MQREASSSPVTVEVGASDRQKPLPPPEELESSAAGAPGAATFRCCPWGPPAVLLSECVALSLSSSEEELSSWTGASCRWRMADSWGLKAPKDWVMEAEGPCCVLPSQSSSSESSAEVAVGLPEAEVSHQACRVQWRCCNV